MQNIRNEKATTYMHRLLAILLGSCLACASLPQIGTNSSGWKPEGGDFMVAEISIQDPQARYVVQLADNEVRKSEPDLGLWRIMILENDFYFAVLYQFDPPPHEGIWVGEDLTVYIEKKTLKVARILQNDFLSYKFAPAVSR